MSIGLDWIALHGNYWEETRLQIEDEAEHGIWTTKDGEQIPVEEMTTSHIKNTIAFIERIDKTDLYLPWIRVFERDLKSFVEGYIKYCGIGGIIDGL